MDPLTPNKIQRLLQLAEDRSFNDSRVLLTEADVKMLAAHAAINKSSLNNMGRCESSSGILDLAHLETFGESDMGDISLTSSKAFNPGELTGRSTGAEVSTPETRYMLQSEELHRHSLALDSFTSQLDKQTNEVNDIMRHSIASNYSFHSKRDLTADEVSLIAREAPLPSQLTHTYFPDSISMNNSNLSVGAYFKHRCPEFGRILGNSDTPEKSMFMMPSITEVSASTTYELDKESNQVFVIDDTLDSVPVRQPRNTENVSKQVNPKPSSEKSRSTRPSRSKDAETAVSKLPVKNVPGHVKSLNAPGFSGHKTFMTSTKPTDMLLKNLHSSFRLMSEETEGSVESSFSISKIADYLGKQSNVSVSDMLKLNNTKPVKKPLKELHLNTQQNQEVHVTCLKDSKNTDAASSAGTVNTVISIDKLNIKENAGIPEVVITRASVRETDNEPDNVNVDDRKSRRSRSKSPSSQSPSTASTVRDNLSYKSGDTPSRSITGEANNSKRIPSPNIEYKELDKSVDWQDVLHLKEIRKQGLSKDTWADIVTTPVEGFVGVNCVVTIKILSLSESWLTAKFKFDDLPNEDNLTIDLPRLPLLLSPRKTEHFVFHITSNIELSTTLPFTICFKDSSIDEEVEHKGSLELNFKIPVVQAMSADGMNKVTFPPIQERSSYAKSFVLINDCPSDLKLELLINEGESMFFIKSVQEVKKGDVNKVLMEKHEDQTKGKAKSKMMSRQPCRLTSGDVIRVIVVFNAPKLIDLQIAEPEATFSGVLNVNLIGGNTTLRKVDLIAVVGTAQLILNVPANKLQISSAGTDVTVTNAGSVPGSWIVKCKSNDLNSFPFNVHPVKFDIPAGVTKTINITYSGPEDCITEETLMFEEITSGNQTKLDIFGGTDKPKIFPIRTNHTTLSWVRAGRKEISLKNASNTKTYVRCHIVGEGFSIDLPGAESRGIYCMQFAGSECRPLPITFAPTLPMPYSATLHLVHDKNSDVSRKIKLFGCESDEAVRWPGLMTISDTALVRAVSRTPVALTLQNKSTAAAFVAAQVHFNPQYMSVEASSRLIGASRVVGPRSRHTVSLQVDWARVESRARESATKALATVTVLTGAEFTRRRILKILRDERDSERESSLLPDHFKVLATQFEGEDVNMDKYIQDFTESKASLSELISSLHELTAHIDLPQDFSDENTIIITDDTIIDHHTICE